MTPIEVVESQPATLPELEHLLVCTARQRSASRIRRPRRWVLALAAAATLLVGGAMAAATGVFHIAQGETGASTYSIDTRPTPAGRGQAASICLELRYDNGVPAYGCGQRPTAAEPFGLVIADSTDGPGQRVVYGLVSSDIARVSVLASGDAPTDTRAVLKPDLPGRFFSVVAPNRGRIELVGYDATGRELARVGSLAPPARPPLSRAEARAQGDPAGFAPAIAAPSSFTYRGEAIAPADAEARGLVCAQSRQGVECYGSLAELEAAQGG